jgi:hypothetical protein
MQGGVTLLPSEIVLPGYAVPTDAGLMMHPMTLNTLVEEMDSLTQYEDVYTEITLRTRERQRMTDEGGLGA